MSQNPSPHAYADCRAFLDRALEQTRGCSAVFKERKSAEYWKLRCLTALGHDRKQNGKIYSRGDSLWNKSMWDPLHFEVLETEYHYWAMSAVRVEFSSGVSAFMELASNHDVGKSEFFSTEEEAEQFRHDCYTRRASDRRRNKNIYAEGDNEWNSSKWDALRFKIRRSQDGKWEVFAVHDATITIEEGVEFVDLN